MKIKDILQPVVALLLFLGAVLAGSFIPWGESQAAAYDAPEVSYTNTVTDQAYLRQTKPDTLMLAGAYGQYDEQFKFFCPAGTKTMSLYYDVKDIQGSEPALGVSGYMIEWYPKGKTEMGNGQVVYDTVTGYGGEGLTFRQVINKLMTYKNGNFVIAFYSNDGTFDHVQNAYSLMYPVREVAGAIQKKLNQNPNFCKDSIYIGEIQPFSK